ncbi:MAG: outer membrane lipoprotein LolB [Gammaproteobacteria bacterium]|nr:MAG: outer membrane lipoprotein LolB [Gammaproteobacteria bacterium]
MNRAAACALGLACLLSAGCALRPTVPGTTVRWAQREAALLALPGWELRGRLALRAADRSGQGRLRWRQQADRGWLRVSGPFGAGAWELRWDRDAATLITGDGEQRSADGGPAALDRLLTRQFGWRLPAAQARYWVLGIPAPGSAARQRFGPDGWLAGIEQGGWRIDYAGFRERDGHWIPRRLSIQRGGFRLKLVVDHWSVIAAAP